MSAELNARIVQLERTLMELSDRLAELERNRSTVPAPFRVVNAAGEHVFQVLLEGDSDPIVEVSDGRNLVVGFGVAGDGRNFLTVWRRGINAPPAIELRGEPDYGELALYRGGEGKPAARLRLRVETD